MNNPTITRKQQQRRPRIPPTPGLNPAQAEQHPSKSKHPHHPTKTPTPNQGQMSQSSQSRPDANVKEHRSLAEPKTRTANRATSLPSLSGPDAAPPISDFTAVFSGGKTVTAKPSLVNPAVSAVATMYPQRPWGSTPRFQKIIMREDFSHPGRGTPRPAAIFPLSSRR